MNNRIEKLAREINALKAQVGNMNTPQLAYSSLEDGAINEYDAGGTLVSVIGKQVDGTHGLNVMNGPVPPAPSDPSVTGGAGVIRVKWNGTFRNDNVAPLDFARVEVHISATPGFEFEPLPNSATRAGSIETAGGGEVALIRVAGTYYIKIITRATTGKYSEPSAEFSVVVDPVVSEAELQEILTEIEEANTNLAGLQVTLNNVQTDLADAEAILAGVDQIEGRLDNLELDVTTLTGEVANAEAAANNAVTQATAAASTAGAAQTAADAAATAANNAAAEAGAATQAAQNAEAEALAAANLVAGKSTVYYGTTAPAGDPLGLWINDGKPYLWDGNEWVEQENSDLVQAVADAQQAKDNAADALLQAAQAKADAAAAQIAAAQAALDAAGAQTAAQSALSAADSASTAANAAAVSADDALDASNAASAAAGAAGLAATNANTVASQAQVAAADAVADADAALIAAQNAVTAGSNAQGVANAASTKADNALTQAQNAASSAATAIGTANAATGAAQAAQNAADAANAEALAAAGLAGSKGEVIYQSTAPTGSRAVSQNLWIRTTDNRPHTYDGSKWVAVTDKVATDAASAASTAQGRADTAWTLANTANTQANAATTAANNAQTAANAAHTAANTAQGAADSANSAALSAAGLAGSKGKVIYSASEPTGVDKVAQNLWIRTTDNKPHTLVGGVWTAITDKAATDAASAAATAQSTANTAKTDAATAQSRADTAWNLANTANGTANTALSTANGKNKVTYSPNAPGTAANTAGDIWFRRDANSVIIGQWEGLGGTSWAARTIGNTVIANLDAGKITSGYIDAARINAGTITVGMIKPGDVATPTQVATAKSEAITAAATDAQNKANAAKTAAEAAAKAYADGEIDAAALATANAAAADAEAKATAAKNAAIAAAATDATSKANAAQSAAISAAATDATTKANNAKAAAETAAALTAQAKADQAKADALTAAAVTAQEKADAAKAQAIASATATAATDAQTKATAAQNAAIAAAATDATTKANNAKAGAEAAAKTYADTAISNRANLVDNPSRTGAVGRWSGVGLTVVNRNIEAITTPVLEFPSTTSTIAYSANGQDMFQIDPTKGYQISVWLEDEKALAAPGTAGNVQIYLGIHVYQGNASTSSNVTPVSVAGVPSAPSNNFYFMNATATTAPIGGMRRYVAYLMPTGTDPANMKNLGVNVSANAILGADARLGRIRVLNYNNQNTPGGRKVWIGHPSVVEVDSVALENAAKAAATADAASGTITLWKHPNATLIDGGKIFTDSITANQIAAGAITASEIASNAVTADKVLANAITAGKIAANAVTATTIAADAITAGKIATDAITARELAANSVTASQIAANAVVAGKVAAGAVTAGTIAANAVAAGTVAADAITGREIKALSIASEHVIAGSIVADKIASGAIVADKLAANAVTADKIVALAITGDKIAANAISADKITSNAITSDKIVANAVTTAKIAALAVTANEIAANAITAEKIQAGQIDVGKLAAGTLSASNIESGYINASVGIGVTGNITVGDTLTKFTALDNMGFGSYLVKSLDGVNTNVPLALFGVGESMVAIADEDGKYMASIDNEGHIEGTSISTPGNMFVDGKLYLNSTEGDPTHDPMEFGPVINGQALFDDQFLRHVENHPRLGVGNKWMLGLGYGSVANETYSIGDFNGATMSTGYTRELAIVSFNVEASRVYRLKGYMGPLRRSGASVYGALHVRYSTGSSPVAYNEGTFLLGGIMAPFESAGAGWMYPEFDRALVGGVDLPVGQVNICMYFQIFSGAADFSANASTSLSVLDEGRTAHGQLSRPNGRSGQPATPAPAPGKKEYTKTYSSTWSSVWNPYGHDAVYDKNVLIAGRSNAGNSYRSYAGFPSMIGDLSGADILKVEIYLYKRWQGYNGTHVAIGFHDAVSRSTTSEPGLGFVGSHNWGGNGGKWIGISSSHFNGFKTGAYRGIAVGRKTGYTSAEWWAEIDRHDDTNKPKIRITYRK